MINRECEESLLFPIRSMCGESSDQGDPGSSFMAQRNSLAGMTGAVGISTPNSKLSPLRRQVLLPYNSCQGFIIRFAFEPGNNVQIGKRTRLEAALFKLLHPCQK